MTNGISDRSGELRVRVDNVERDIGHIEQQISAIRDTMATRADMERISASISSLASRHAEITRPQYGLLVSVVGLGVTILVVLGGFAYWPISTTTSDLKLAVITLAEKTVPHRQYEADVTLARTERVKLREDLNVTVQQQRYNTDKAAIDIQLANIRERMLTKSEFDVQHRDLKDYISTVRGERNGSVESILRRLERIEALHIKP
jgi:hypothetical protein